jgi:methylated-DNA-[protein]-cysteine S-methyltransferase
MLVASDEGLRAVVWEHEQSQRIKIERSVEHLNHPILLEASKQLEEYFSAKRRGFHLKLDPSGTSFQLKAWQALSEIPFGQTRSYGEQAQMMGSPKAVRAVGAANGKNPISIIVPCHRVIGKNGSLTGFGGGLSAKRKLLELEGIVV